MQDLLVPPVGVADLAAPPIFRDLAAPVIAPDLGCALGTPDHCGGCGTVCPPGADDVGTRRTCTGSTCDVICLGEYYDLDGKLTNGCEALDTPVQDSALTALSVTLPAAYGTTDLGTMGNPSNEVGFIYADMRMHATAPTSRPNGRADWWKLIVSGGGDAASGVTACLGIVNLPTDDQYEVCLSSVGNASFTPAGCQTVLGGASSVCVSQPQAADESGTYYVRVQRLAGSNTPLGYALYLKH
jgi:hypothetical protein